MRRNVGTSVALAVVLAVVVIAAMYVYAPVGAPAGYHFPRHPMFGGSDALYEGILVERDGCVTTQDGDTIVWPPGYAFEIRDERLVVVGGGRIVRIGEPVALGGGWHDLDTLPEPARGAAGMPCGDAYFVTTGWAD